MNGFPEKILLATDGLVSTATAARAAVDLTEKGGAELHVVHVWHTVPSPHFLGHHGIRLAAWSHEADSAASEAL